MKKLYRSVSNAGNEWIGRQSLAEERGRPASRNKALRLLPEEVRARSSRNPDKPLKIYKSRSVSERRQPPPRTPLSPIRSRDRSRSGSRTSASSMGLKHYLNPSKILNPWKAPKSMRDSRGGRRMQNSERDPNRMEIEGEDFRQSVRESVKDRYRRTEGQRSERSRNTKTMKTVVNMMEREKSDEQRIDVICGSRIKERKNDTDPEPGGMAPGNWVRSRKSQLLAPGSLTWVPVSMGKNIQNDKQHFLDVTPAHGLASKGITFRQFTMNCKAPGLRQDANRPAVLIQNLTNVYFQLGKRQRIGTVLRK